MSDVRTGDLRRWIASERMFIVLTIHEPWPHSCVIYYCQPHMRYRGIAIVYDDIEYVAHSSVLVSVGEGEAPATNG